MQNPIPEDCARWWASVKYKNFSEEKEYVPVSNIFEEDAQKKRIPFRPKSYEDYVYGKMYCIKTSRRSADNKEHFYYGAIGRMAGSKEELKATSNGRTKWPVMHESECEPASSCTEGELGGSTLVLKTRTLNQQRAISKKSGQTARFATFMTEEAEPVQEPPPTEHILTEDTATGLINTSMLGKVAARLEQNQKQFETLLEFMKEKFDSQEAKAARNQREASDLNKEMIGSIREEVIGSIREEVIGSISAEVIKSISAEVTKNIREEITESIREEIAEVKDLLCKSPNQSKITSVQNWLESIHNL